MFKDCREGMKRHAFQFEVLFYLQIQLYELFTYYCMNVSSSWWSVLTTFIRYNYREPTGMLFFSGTAKVFQCEL